MVSLRREKIKLAVVGGETLLGRDIQEVLKDRGFGDSVTSYAATGEGNFGEEEGEAVYVEPLKEGSIRNDRAILMAGTPEGGLKAYELAKKGGGKPILIDCTGNLENQPEARIVAPLLGEPEVRGSWLLVMAHPAASALALILTRLARRKRIVRAVAEVFEPASERGKNGITELHQQTTSLLAFKPQEKKVFDAQLAFNLLAQYGEDAPEKLSAAEQRIERHLATLLSGEESAAPMPSIRLIQAPVFHGYSMSLWVEFESAATAEELGEALASAQIEIRGAKDEPPNGVGAASQSGLAVGDIRIDRNHARAAWFWAVGDNLRLIADGAVELVRGMAEKR